LFIDSTKRQDKDALTLFVLSEKKFIVQKNEKISKKVLQFPKKNDKITCNFTQEKEVRPHGKH